jgi:hypothetical protein
VLKHALEGTLPSTITLDDLIVVVQQIDWKSQPNELSLLRLSQRSV